MWRPIMFCLIVNDFGIKYMGAKHAQHLCNTLQEHYTITTNWTGSKFVNIELDWDYTKCTCRLAMKNYIDKVLLKYGHTKPTKPQLSPHKHTEIQYVTTAQYTHAPDSSPQLDKAGIK